MSCRLEVFTTEASKLSNVQSNLEIPDTVLGL